MKQRFNTRLLYLALVAGITSLCPKAVSSQEAGVTGVAALIGKDESSVTQQFPDAKAIGNGSYAWKSDGDEMTVYTKSGKVVGCTLRGVSAREHWKASAAKLGVPTANIKPTRKPDGIHLEPVDGLSTPMSIIWRKTDSSLTIGDALASKPTETSRRKLPPAMDLVKFKTPDLLQAAMGTPDDGEAMPNNYPVYRFPNLKLTFYYPQTRLEMIDVNVTSPTIKNGPAAMKAIGLDPAKASIKRQVIEGHLFVSYRWKSMPNWVVRWIDNERKLMLSTS